MKTVKIAKSLRKKYHIKVFLTVLFKTVFIYGTGLILSCWNTDRYGTHKFEDLDFFLRSFASPLVMEVKIGGPAPNQSPIGSVADPDPHVFGPHGSGSGSISQRHGSADPDPDPQPCR